MRRSRATGALFALVACAALSSCATKPASVPGNPFAALGDGASAYFSFPVAGNRELASLFDDFVDGRSLRDALDRTDIVRGAALANGELRLVARGNYPRSLARFAFPKSRGWKKTSAKGTGSWYTRDALDAAIPQSGIACVVRRANGGNDATASDGRSGIKAILAGLKNPAPSTLPGNFVELSNDGANDGEIILLVTDLSPWVERLLGPDVTLPVEYAIMRARATGETLVTGESRATGDALAAESADAVTYAVSAAITAKDSRTARAMLTLLRLAFQRYDVSAADREIRVEGIEASASTLVEFARNLYF